MTNRAHGKPLPSAKYLRERYRYDPDTGKIYFRINIGGKKIGDEALTATTNAGLKTGFVDGIQVSASRIIYKMQTGRDPEIVRHRNGNRSDNRWKNLKHVTRSRSGKSGVPGVIRQGSQWRVKIGSVKTGQAMHVGYFKTKKDAIAARRQAEVEMGYRKA